jgi:hypothetical protein
MAFNGKPPAAGKGRPKGALNKVTGQLKDMILGALSDAGGKEYLLKQAKENPTAFMTLIGKVLPSDINVSGADGGPIAYAVAPDKAKNMEEWAQQSVPPELNKDE